jgi:hypothetical protein
VKARSLGLLTYTYVGTIGCKLPSTYVGAKCYSLVIASIIERTTLMLRISVIWYQHNLLEGGMVWGIVMAIGCKCNSTTYIYI